VVVEVGIQEQGVGKDRRKKGGCNNEEDNCFELIQTESEYVQWKEQQPEPPIGTREKEKGLREQAKRGNYIYAGWIDCR